MYAYYLFLLIPPNGENGNVFSPLHRLDNPSQKLPEGKHNMGSFRDRRHTVQFWSAANRCDYGLDWINRLVEGS